MASLYLIYALCDPQTEEIRYVGKSCSGLHRPRRHTSPCELKAHTHKNHWVLSLVEKGLRSLIRILEEFPTAYLLPEAEQKWIEDLKKSGASLTNATNGGIGMLGYCPSEETRKKLSAGKKGWKAPPETLRRMAEAARGKRWSMEARERMSEYRKGRPLNHSLETRIATAERNRNRVWTDEMRERASESHKGQPSAMKGVVMSEESKIKMSRARGVRPFADQNGTVYQTHIEAEQKTGVGRWSIRMILRGRTTGSKGYVFHYLEPKPQDAPTP